MVRLLTFSEDPQANQLVALPRRKATPLWHRAAILPTLRDALRDGFAAHRRYEHLTSRGYRVNTAIRMAFGCGNQSHQRINAAVATTVCRSDIAITRSQQPQEGA